MSPWRIASSVSSRSLTWFSRSRMRARSDAVSSGDGSGVIGAHHWPRNDFESPKDVSLLRQVTNDTPHRERQQLDQSWSSNDLIRRRELGLLVNIDDFEIYMSGQMLFADA